MEIVILAVIAIIGGAIVGWTSASNMDKNPMTTPHIFRKVDPMYFIGAGLIGPAIVGYVLISFWGIIASLVITWLSSVIIGSTIQNKN